MVTKKSNKEIYTMEERINILEGAKRSKSGNRLQNGFHIYMFVVCIIN